MKDQNPPQKELLELVKSGREERNLEYKASKDWKDPTTKAKITKTILGMANIRDGGVIVLGVEEIKDQSRFNFKGMLPEHLGSYNHDNIASHVGEYADPFVEFTVRHVEDDNKTFVVIQIKEFSELPVLCKKSGKENLRKGALYTRRKGGKNETIEVPTSTEMREILDLAVDKNTRKFHERISRSRIPIPIQKPKEPDDSGLFEEQIEDL